LESALGSLDLGKGCGVWGCRQGTGDRFTSDVQIQAVLVLQVVQTPDTPKQKMWYIHTMGYYSAKKSIDTCYNNMDET
jgi:hypothetical protein